MVRDQLEITDQNTIAVQGRSSKTSLPGVFAAGDVIDPTYRQAIIAAGFTPIAYYQRLNVMLDDERVRAAAPQMIDVLRARRDAD